MRPVCGVATPMGAVVSVPAVGARRRPASRAEKGEQVFAANVGALVGFEGAQIVRAVFRYSEHRIDLPDAGTWMPRDDPRVPSG